MTASSRPRRRGLAGPGSSLPGTPQSSAWGPRTSGWRGPEFPSSAGCPTASAPFPRSVSRRRGSGDRCNGSPEGGGRCIPASGGSGTGTPRAGRKSRSRDVGIRSCTGTGRSSTTSAAPDPPGQCTHRRHPRQLAIGPRTRAGRSPSASRCVWWLPAAPWSHLPDLVVSPHAEAISADGASREPTGAETVSTSHDVAVGSLDEPAGPIFSGPRRPIGGVRVKLSRCWTPVDGGLFGRKKRLFYLAYEIKLDAPDRVGIPTAMEGLVLRRMTIDKTYMYCRPGYSRRHAKKCRSGVWPRHTHSRVRGEGSGMDENERITLRLEKENLELIDGFLKENTSHGNRSQLVREAVQAYIQAIREGGDRVTIHVPRYYLDLIDRLVADGYLLNREHAIVRSIEEWFTRERVKEIQDHKQEVDKATGKVVSVSTGDKDGVIPR